MKPNGSVRVVKMWCDIHTDPVLGSFDDLGELNYRNLLVSMDPKLTSWLTV
jgi:hypothetical protein